MHHGASTEARQCVKCVLGERKGDKNYRCHRHRGTVWEQVRSIYRNFRRDADDDRDGSHSNRDDCFLFFFSSPLASSSPPRHARRADIVPHHGSRVSFSLPLSCFPLFSPRVFSARAPRREATDEATRSALRSRRTCTGGGSDDQRLRSGAGRRDATRPASAP